MIPFICRPTFSNVVGSPIVAKKGEKLSSFLVSQHEEKGCSCPRDDPILPKWFRLMGSIRILPIIASFRPPHHHSCYVHTRPGSRIHSWGGGGRWVTPSDLPPAKLRKLTSTLRHFPFSRSFFSKFPLNEVGTGKEPASEASREKFRNMGAQNPVFGAYFYHFRTGPLICEISWIPPVSAPGSQLCPFTWWGVRTLDFLLLTRTTTSSPSHSLSSEKITALSPPLWPNSLLTWPVFHSLFYFYGTIHSPVGSFHGNNHDQVFFWSSFVVFEHNLVSEN